MANGHLLPNGHSAASDIKYNIENRLNQETEVREAPPMAQVSEYPWMVGVGVRATLSPMCGAALVSDRYIMTAAHCCSG